MTSKLSGGCACGAIRYESDAAPTVMLNCHCSDCRKASGSGYAAIVIVQKSSLQLSGEARFHKLRGGSGSTNGKNDRDPPADIACSLQESRALRVDCSKINGLIDFEIKKMRVRV